MARLLFLSLLLAGPALAQEEAESPFAVSVHGDVKSFGVATFPYDHLVAGTTWEPPCTDSPLLPPDVCVPNYLADPDDYVKVKAAPSGQGIWNFRLKFEAAYSDVLKLQIHHVANATLGSAGESQLQSFGTGVGIVNAEVVDLSWDADFEGDSLALIGITDRLNLTFSQPGIDITLGRQPVSFGNGMFFTPLDLVNPFTPTTIDTEYKPGVDALRIDGFFGMTGKVTAVAAYAGDWTAEDMVFAVHGQGTVGVTDIGGFAGYVHAEPVVGVSTVSSVGAFGLHGDLALTLPEDDDPFVRGVVGTMVRPTGTSTLTAEAYVQTFGTTDPDAYLLVATQDRFARGEVWNFGVAYGAVSWGQEITPLVSVNGAVIANLTDPSAMVAPNLSWSVAENATVGIGGFAGIGARPDKGVKPFDLVDSTCMATATDPMSCQLGDRALAKALGLNSEFGTYPAAVFANIRTYF